ACGRLTGGQARAAHVTFAHDAPRLGILRHIVRAHHHAVLAANALVIEMAHDARDRILVVGEHRAAIKARRVNTMMTRRRDDLLKRCAPIGRGQPADAAPGFLLIEPVERMACGYASLAAAALVEVHLERVLLT